MRIFKLNAVGVLALCGWVVSAMGADNFNAQLAFEVRTPGGKPVPDAEVSAALRYWSEDPYGRLTRTVAARTDARGQALLQGVTYGTMSYAVSHPDFYSTFWSLAFRGPMLRQSPVLRPVVSPVPMVALKSIALPIPVERVDLPFDLVKADWLPPHGAGEYEDVRIRVASVIHSELRFIALMDMRFTGEHNGIVPMGKRVVSSTSVFRSAYEAPETGYLPVHRFESSQGLDPETDNAGTIGWYFRIRSRVNDRGEVGGLYGKFYENPLRMDLSGAQLLFPYLYVQPVFNSRNMEFDRSRNHAPQFTAARWHSPAHLEVELP